MKRTPRLGRAKPGRGRIRGAFGAVALISVAGATWAEMRPSLNFYGTTGLIDMPAAGAQPDGQLSITSAHFGPISRNTLTFQLAPRISASFRYLAVRDFDDVVPDLFDIYYDRSFDLSFAVLDEGTYLPAVTVGFQDFVGTGILSGEYIVASKQVTPRVRLSAGLGWGRLGSFGSLASVGTRPPIEIGSGGNFNFDQFFRGDVAPFGGIEWAVNDRWTVKAEYSSDDYTEEAGLRRTFERKSPFNFGVEYQRGPGFRVGAYYLYGSEVGIAAHFILDPDRRPSGAIGGTAPDPVRPRPPRATDPDAWSEDWVTQPGANALLRANIARNLAPDGIVLEALAFTGQVVQVRIRNATYDAEAQAVGRTARVLSRTMPASVEGFEIVPVVDGMPTSKITLRRSDIEALEFAPGAAEALRPRVTIAAPGQPMAGLAYDPALYPRFSWGLAPYTRFRLFDQTDPFKADLGLRLSGRAELGGGFVLSGAITKKLAGNLDDPPPPIVTGLQPVRSDVDVYDAKGDPALERLTAAWTGYLGGDLYGRVSLGYLERMFGGISTEVLWKPASSRWALGAEANYVGQRDPDQGLGFDFYDYRVATGHLSAYYDFGGGYLGQLDVGRYLAGDMGATLSLDREFANGWKVGAFATLTDASAEEFGSGSFDKGIRLQVPFSWLTGQPTRQERVTVLRPFGRDGGARLEVEGRLYETVRDYQTSGLDAQWGRFWK